MVVARGLGSCGTWASLLQGMRHLPGPGIEPMSSAFTCGFLVPNLKKKLFVVEAPGSRAQAQ